MLLAKCIKPNRMCVKKIKAFIISHYKDQTNWLQWFSVPENNAQFLYYKGEEGNVFPSVYLLGEYCPNTRDFTKEKVKQLKKKKDQR